MNNFKTSKVSLVLKMVIGLFLISSLLGCLSVRDRVPKGMPKGCIKFYKYTRESIGIQAQVYRIENNEKIFAGRTSNWGFGKETGLKLFLPPGEYDFLLTLATAETNVHVRVEEDTMTPVRISFPFVKISTQDAYPRVITTTNFKVLLTVEAMLPIE